MIWKIAEKHAQLKFSSYAEEFYACDQDPLFGDEAAIQWRDHGIENFRFNDGYGKIHYTRFAASINKVYVDPSCFILIKGIKNLIKESIAFEWYRISYKKYIAAVFAADYLKFDKAIIFGATEGLNVFHFYNDLIVKLFVAREEYQLLPLLISEQLYNSKLFRFYLQFGFVNKLQWVVVPAGKHVFVKEAVLIKAKAYDAEKLKIISDLALPRSSGTGTPDLKLFINRKETAGRYISNFPELEPTLVKLGFTIMYLEDLTVEEQVSYCSKANVIAGVHGAGLTNMIFAYKNRPKILEITPADFIPTHYYWLANAFGFSYKLLLGGKIQGSSGGHGFVVNKERFEKIIASY